MERVKKAAIVFGTRPEAIKLAPVYHAFTKQNAIKPVVWLTGQHEEMVEQVMETFELSAERNFRLMSHNQTLTRITTEVLRELQDAFAEERPDLVIVQGDTTSCFATALAAFYQKIPVAHVEAGLRTEDKFSPYPEEMNRRLTTSLTDLHFAPTVRARDNLLAENVPAERIWITGNTVIDALDYTVTKVRRTAPELSPDFPLGELSAGRKMVLITGHRRESFGQGFECICQAISELAAKFPEALFIYPVHLNPNVREPVFRVLGGKPNVFLIEPLEYRAFVWAMDRCFFLLSDSGGVQEEAPHLGKPVLVMRDTTERPEALDAGTAKLVGTEVQTIVREASILFEKREAYAAMSEAKNPFGDGHAAGRIVKVCTEKLR